MWPFKKGHLTLEEILIRFTHYYSISLPFCPNYNSSILVYIPVACHFSEINVWGVKYCLSYAIETGIQMSYLPDFYIMDIYIFFTTYVHLSIALP